MTIEIAREELYNLVWRRPAKDVARELDVAYSTLAKRCRSNDIPLPPRGHWAQIAAGQFVPRTPLPKKSEPAGGKILLSRAATRSRPRPDTLDATTRDAIVEEDALLLGGVLSQMAQRLQKRLTKQSANRNGLLKVLDTPPCAVSIAPNSIERVVNIVNRLSHLVETAGHRVVADAEKVGIEANGYLVSVLISETLHAVPHVMTDKERRQTKRCVKKQKKLGKTGECVPRWKLPVIPEWDHVPSGYLEVRIDEGAQADGLRRKFADGSNQRIEWLLPQIIAAAVACAAAAGDRQETQRNLQEQQRVSQTLSDAQLRKNALNDRRVELLERVKADWLAAESIDAFLGTFLDHHQSDELPEKVLKFVKWTKKRSKTLRNRSSVERISEVIDEFDLMNKDSSPNGKDKG